MIDFSTPLQGMQTAMDRVNLAARQIAQSADPNAGDTVDLSTEAVALLEARNAFTANVKVAKTVDEMNRSLIDMLG
jgi:flagellar hook-associated protein FlgK